MELGLEYRGVAVCEKRLTGDVKAEGTASPMRVFCCCVAAPRLVTKRSRVLLDRTVRDLRRDTHSMPTLAGIERGAQLRPFTITEFWPAEDLALCAPRSRSAFIRRLILDRAALRHLVGTRSVRTPRDRRDS